jgi:hypothetical protein
LGNGFEGELCDVLSRFAALKLIGIPNVNQVKLIDARELVTISSEGFDPALGPYYGRREHVIVGQETQRLSN